MNPRGILQDWSYWPLYPLVMKPFRAYLEDYLGLARTNTIEYQLPRGTKLLARPGTTDRVAVQNIWVKNSFLITREFARRCRTVLDLGAHVGSFTMYMASLASSAKIVSYEPEPSNFSLLTRNVAANNLFHRVKVKNEAVFGVEGRIELQIGEDSIGHSIVVPEKESITVRAVNLATAFRENGISNCDLLKLNVEGAEGSILKSAGRELLSRVGAICFQVHKNAPENLDLECYLKSQFSLTNRRGDFIFLTNPSYNRFQSEYSESLLGQSRSR